MNVFIIIGKWDFLPDHSNMRTSIKARLFFRLKELSISISSDVGYSLFFDTNGWLVSVALSVSLLYYNIAFNIFRHVFMMLTNCAGWTTSSIFVGSFRDSFAIIIASSRSASNKLISTITYLDVGAETSSVVKSAMFLTCVNSQIFVIWKIWLIHV